MANESRSTILATWVIAVATVFATGATCIVARMTIAAFRLAKSELDEMTRQGELGQKVLLVYDVGTFRVPIDRVGDRYVMTNRSAVLRMGNFGGAPAIHTWIEVIVTHEDGAPIPHQTRRYEMPSLQGEQSISVAFAPEQILRPNGPRRVNGTFVVGSRTYHDSDSDRRVYDFTATVIHGDSPFVEIEIRRSSSGDPWKFRFG